MPLNRCSRGDPDTGDLWRYGFRYPLAIDGVQCRAIDLNAVPDHVRVSKLALARCDPWSFWPPSSWVQGIPNLCEGVQR